MERYCTTLALLLLTSCVYHNGDAGETLGPTDLSVTPNRLIVGSDVQISVSVFTADNLPAAGLSIEAVVDGQTHTAQAMSNITDSSGTWTALLQDLSDGSHIINAQVVLHGARYPVDPNGIAVQVLAAVNNIEPTSNTASVQSGAAQNVGVMVTDALGSALAGDVVTFTATPAGVTFSPTQTTTDTEGHASVVAMATRAGTYTVTMSDSSNATTTNITILPGPASITNSSFTAAPTSLGAGSATTLTARVADGYGNAIDGQAVTFTASGSSNTFSAASVTTDATGTATTTLTSTVAETKTVSAAFAGGALQAAVTFTGSVATTVNLAASPTTVTANGINASVLTATVTDGQGHTVSGAVVTFTSAGTNVTLTPVQATTNSAGVATSKVVSTTAQTTSVQASIPGAAGIASITFTTSDSFGYALQLSSPTGTADGTNPVVFTLHVTDSGSNPIAGVPITFSTSATQTTLSATTGLTNANGDFATDVTTTAAQSVYVVATSGSQSASNTAVFGPGTLANLTLSAFPSATANNTNPVSLTARATDAFGNPISGQSITLAATGTSLNLSAISGNTSSSGTLSASVTSSVAQVATITASSGGRSATASATFVAGAPTNAALIDLPTPVSADGVSFCTLTTLVVDAYSNPVPGASVSFTASGSNNVFSPITGSSDAQGKFVTTLKSTTAETKTVTTSISGNPAASQVVQFTTAANGAVAINVAPTTGLVTTAVGGAATFTVNINSQPTANVILPIASNSPAVQVSPAALTFTAANWTTPQQVTLTGRSVGQYGGSTAVSVNLGSASSSDSRYDGYTPAHVAVTALNNAIPNVQPVYTNGALWNTWVVNNGNSVLNANNAPCTGSETGAFTDACLHGGELRSVVMTDTNDCTSITASDSLGAFNWACETTLGDVRVYSTGLKVTAGMSTLVDFANTTWLDNTLTVSRAGNALFTTASAIWWNNPVIVLNTNNAPLFLNNPNTLYTTNQNITFSSVDTAMTMTASNVSLAIQPNRAVAGGNTLVFADQQKFLWVEGTFNGNSNTSVGVLMTTVIQAQVRNSSFSNFTAGAGPTAIELVASTRVGVLYSSFQNSGAASGSTECGSPSISMSACAAGTMQGLKFTGSISSDIALDKSASIVVNDLKSVLAGLTTICSLQGIGNSYSNIRSETTGHAIDLKTSVAEVVRQVYIANTYDVGLYIIGATAAIIDGVNTFNTASGGWIASGAQIHMHNALFAQSGASGYGLLVSDTKDSEFVNVTVVNSVGPGLETQTSTNNVFLNTEIAGANGPGFSFDAQSSSNTVVNLAVSNAYNAISLAPNSRNFFRGALSVGGNPNECFAPSVSGTGLTTANGGTSGGFGPCIVDASNSNAIASHGTDVSSSFVGFVTGDTNNGTTNLSNFPYSTTALDWIGFIRANRGWGAYDAAVIDLNSPMVCGVNATQSPNCRVYDFNLSATDSVIRGVLLRPTGGNGANVVSHNWSSGAAATFIANAAQAAGSSEFLCETNATCLYTPNFGAYQGHGTPVYVGQTSSTDIVGGVTLMQYPSNGY